MSSRKARRDIQGIRAFAVLVVFLDHLFGWPSGGFTGVDMFFVISGFLITGLLLRQYERDGAISARKFYIARFKRIVPAATLTLIVTVVMTRLILGESRSAGVFWDAVWAFLFGANWNFAAQGTDYFQKDAAVSPLQHYWSLSVEEQFYFVWPWLLLGLLILVAKFTTMSPNKVRTVALSAIGALSVASFVWALVQVTGEPTVAYFSTFTRAWELGVGAIIAVVAPVFMKLTQPIRISLAYGGLALMLASLFVITPTTVWPAPWALLPVFGTALVIISGVGEEARFNWALTNPVSTYIGDISYSLYLWHFPAIVIGNAVTAGLGWVGYVVTLLAGFALAIGAYYAVERPIHQSPLWTPNAKQTWHAWRTNNAQPAGIGALMMMVTAGATMAAATIIQFSPQPVPDNVADLKPDTAATASPAQAELGSHLSDALASSSWPADFEAQLAAAGQGDREIRRCADPSTYSPEGCTWGDGERTAVVVGDSLASAYVGTLTDLLVPQGWTVRSLALNGCEFNSLVLASERSAATCDGLLQKNISMISSTQPDVVFVTSQWATHRRAGSQANLSFGEWWPGAEDALAQLASTGVPIVYMAPPPYEKSIDSCYSALAQPADCISTVTPTWSKSETAIRGFIDGHEQMSYVSSHDWFCIETKCPAFSHGLLTRIDQVHPSRPYLTSIKDVIAEALTAPLKQLK
ncbi:MAG TPA: acyltransferase family protein [Marmoricola sp.]|nr:acyltransferase family protein [Marmoricola sp.]